MVQLSDILNGLLILWPLFITLGAYFFYSKQNSRKAWTGGPISTPKAFWLAFTVLTWFLAPVIFCLHPDFPSFLRFAFYFHLLSWWVRGPLELVMIYRWKNWSPRYGIGHDLVHMFVFVALILVALPEASTGSFFHTLSFAFALLIVYSTVFEVFFAWKFKAARTAQEEAENIYFASDDPKWRRINQWTLRAVVICMGHLTLQSLALVFKVLQ